MATKQELDAAIAVMERQLNSAVTQIAEGGNMVKRDLRVLRERLSELRAERDALDGARAPMVRRVLVTSRKGY
jgi:hypothetical protein